MNRPIIAVMTRPIDNRSTSGSGKHLIEILQALLELDHGLDITFVHNMDCDHPLYRHPDVKEIKIPRNPLKASKILRDQNFDLNHYSPVSIMSPMWGIKAKKTGTIHNAEPVLIPRHFPLWQVIHEYLGCRPMSRKLDGIATVSWTSREFLAKFYNIPESLFTICYNSYNHNYKVLNEENLLHKEPFLYHVSKFSPRKNPWVLLSSFALLKQEFPELRLKISGSKWDNPQVDKELTLLGIQDDVDLLGFSTEEDIIHNLNRASAFVFPSLCEGFGIPNIEAQACGCPVVTSAAFAIPEVLLQPGWRM
jgi:glycosyltransferase involved in cell wall biosynthesis